MKVTFKLNNGRRVLFERVRQTYVLQLGTKIMHELKVYTIINVISSYEYENCAPDVLVILKER